MCGGSVSVQMSKKMTKSVMITTSRRTIITSVTSTRRAERARNDDLSLRSNKASGIYHQLSRRLGQLRRRSNKKKHILFYQLRDAGGVQEIY